MPSRFVHQMPFGAEIVGGDAVRFRLWAPSQSEMTLVLEGPHPSDYPMRAIGDGWFELTLSDAGPGSLYRYRLQGGLAVPDPASRFQPNDVHGPSQVIDPTVYAWNHPQWIGRPWEDTVLYELHVGCFSDEGSFDGVRRRLDHFTRLGITAIELMPIADFEGTRNWGYDGVLPFAPDSAYGAPDNLKRLVDEAHARELMVFLDVVYNHFGPSGNYLSQYAARFFTERHHTPWGPGINFEDQNSRAVRDFFVHNALYWLDEYRVDGLRFDAVHAILDDSDRHILNEIAAEVRRHVGPARHVHLVLENDDNVTRFLTRGVDRSPQFYDAQWNDDFHHAAHVIATGERAGYYRDYADDPVAAFGRALSEGFVYQGEPSAHRGGKARGEPSAHLPPTAFVSFLQNHDQIGNRACGERLTALADARAVRALQAILMLSPQIPFIFMGEEWGTRRPFLYFCDFHDDLADAVREGRRREFEHDPAFKDPVACQRIPDPNAVTTYERSRLDWNEADSDAGRNETAFVRALLDVRRCRIVPLLYEGIDAKARHTERQSGIVAVQWTFGDRRLDLIANLGRDEVNGLGWNLSGEPIFAIPAHICDGPRLERLPPWSVVFTIGAPQ
ncbi:MAG TPA: malto-oligosyltrehalose trehalohydrolase [Alphaproteobacteria bacterium]|nr:malto-oligosyltrehalose trehalohydrolase [Alphaproteobacteria bacterium]